MDYTLIGPRTQETKPLFSVLVADAIAERTNAFRLEGQNYKLRMVSTLPAFVDALNSSWDVLFTSCYLGRWPEYLEQVEHICRAFGEGRLKQVICFSPLTHDGEKFCRALREEGVPVKYFPYNYQNPRAREEHKF